MEKLGQTQEKLRNTESEIHTLKSFLTSKTALVERRKKELQDTRMKVAQLEAKDSRRAVILADVLEKTARQYQKQLAASSAAASTLTTRTMLTPYSLTAGERCVQQIIPMQSRIHVLYSWLYSSNYAAALFLNVHGIETRLTVPLSLLPPGQPVPRPFLPTVGASPRLLPPPQKSTPGCSRPSPWAAPPPAPRTGPPNLQRSGSKEGYAHFTPQGTCRLPIRDGKFYVAGK